MMVSHFSSDLKKILHRSMRGPPIRSADARDIILKSQIMIEELQIDVGFLFDLMSIDVRMHLKSSVMG